MDDRNQGVMGNGTTGGVGAQGASPDPTWGTTTPNMPTATETTTTATSAQPVSQASFQPIDRVSTPLTTTVDPVQSQPINQVPVQPMTTMDAAAPSGAKKKKTGMIVGVAVAVATLIGGGAYAYVHNMPEKVQYDAVNGLLNADHIQIEGEISAVPADTELSGGINSIKLELKQATANLNYDVDASLKVSAETMGDVSVSLGGAFIEDGTIYIKVGNLQESLKKAFDMMGGMTGGASFYDSLEQSTGGLIGEIDGQWWKISVDELADNLSKNSLIDSDAGDMVKATWKCLMESLKYESGRKDEYVKLYKENSFVVTTKTSGSLANGGGANLSNFEKAGDIYDVKMDADKLTNFLNAAARTINIDKLGSCYANEGLISSKDVDEAKEKASAAAVEKSDIEEVISKLPTMKVAIKGWNHELKGIYLNYNNDSANATGAITISYDKSRNVTAPSDAKPITDLIDKIIPLVQSQSGGGSRTSYCDPSNLYITECIPYEDQNEDYYGEDESLPIDNCIHDSDGEPMNCGV